MAQSHSNSSKKEQAKSVKTYFDAPVIQEIVEAVLEIDKYHCVIGPEQIKELRQRAEAGDYVAKLTLQKLVEKYGSLASHLDNCFMRFDIEGTSYGIIFSRTLYSAIKVALGLAGKEWESPFTVSNVLIPEDKMTIKSFCEITKQGQKTIIHYEIALPGRYPFKIIVTKKDEFEQLKQRLNGLTILLGRRKKEGFGLCHIYLR